MEVIDFGVSPSRKSTLTDQLDDEIVRERRHLESLGDRVSALVSLREAVEARSAALGRPCTVDDLLTTRNEVKRPEVAALVRRITKEEL